jgi:peroxiredoxin
MINCWCRILCLSAIAGNVCSPIALASEAPESKSTRASFDVPDGSPQSLLEFIRATKARFVEGKTRDERVEFSRRQQYAIWAATDKILVSRPPVELETDALTEKFAALWNLAQLGDDKATQEIAKLAQNLKDDSRKQLAHRARAVLLWDHLRALRRPVAHVELTTMLDDIENQLKSGNRDKVFLMLAADVPQLFAQSDRALALEGAKKFAAILAKDRDERVQRVVSQLDSFERRMATVGQSIEIQGPLIDGGELDWNALQGKVVLIDYWATWCQPCVAEIPNVLAIWRDCRGRGFEVVAISLDEDRAKLAQFVNDGELPWPVVCGRSREESGMRHPMAVKYGVNSIPRTFLVDRGGKVVALDAHGETLRAQVERLLEMPARATHDRQQRD